MVKFSFLGAFGGILKFVIAHWYWIMLVIILIPTIITSVSVAKETSNPSYPFVQLGLRLSNADHVIYEDVQTLISNPEEIVGVAKEEGIWNSIKYWWLWFWNVFLRFASNVWLIAFPFVLAYKFFRMRNTSTPIKNLMFSIMVGLIFIFLINSFLTIHGIVKGTIDLTFPAGSSMFIEVWHIIKLVIPFHGIASLVSYLITLV